MAIINKLNNIITNLDINAPCGVCCELVVPDGILNVTPKGKNPKPADIDIPPRLKALLPKG